MFKLMFPKNITTLEVRFINQTFWDVVIYIIVNYL